MTTFGFITTAQLAAARGVTRQAVTAAVRRGTLTPAHVLPDGAFLFTPEPPK
jgi:hypothetical protein